MKKIYILAAASLALVACDKNDDNPALSSVEAKISASIEGHSRASDASWAKDDSIGITVTAGNNVQPHINMKYTTDGSETFTGKPIYFYKPMTLTAYYPFRGEEGTAQGTIETVTDAGNQAEDKRPEIDFLWDRQTEYHVVENKPEIHFAFSHKMSKLTLIFKNGNDGTDVSKIKTYTITGLVLDGSFDTESGECAAKEDVESADLEIELPEGTVKPGETVPSLLLFPQSTAGKTVTLKIKDSENQDYACTLNFGDDGLVSGNNYLYTIKVSKTGLSVKSSITDWDTKELDDEAKSDDSDE